MTPAEAATGRARLPVGALIAVGLAAGVLSGAFGVGGGIIVVPLLVLLGLDQRIAAGSSTAAILPTAIVGATGYALNGDVDWIAAAALAVGIIVGAQVGTYLLSRMPRAVLFWLFVVFLAAVVVSLWIVIPSRTDTIDITALSIAGLVALGVATGVLSGVMGIGGGVLAVPALILLFGAGDLVAKGTSLLMMIPGSISATISNAKRRNFDLRVAAIVGLTACVASPLGILLAGAMTPLVSNIAFSALMVLVMTQMIVKHLRSRRRPG